MNKVAVLFPGQGSQYVGMGNKLFNKYNFVRDVFEEASDAINVDMKKLCFEGSIKELSKTENAQPAILTVGVAAYKAFMHEMEVEIKPSFFAGHSLGEFTALVCANGMTFFDAVRITKLRGHLFQKAVSGEEGLMCSISGVDADIIKNECSRISKEGNIASISNYNSPYQTVISGHKEAVSSAVESLEKRNAQVIPLKVSVPFHCGLMEPAVQQLKEELDRIPFKTPDYPIISNVTAAPYSSKEAIAPLLVEQATRPIQWVKTMSFLRNQNVTVIIDIGPSQIIRNLALNNYNNIAAFSYDRDENFITNLTNKVHNKSSEIRGYEFIKGCVKNAICSPNHNHDNEEIEDSFIKPYRRLISILEQYEMEKAQVSEEDMTESFDSLIKILISKKTPESESHYRINALLNETGTYNMYKNPFYVIGEDINFKIR